MQFSKLPRKGRIAACAIAVPTFLALVLGAGCVTDFPQSAFLIVDVRHDFRNSNYLIGNLTWDSTGGMVWGPEPSPKDPGGPAGDAVAGARANAGSTLYQAVQTDAQLLPAPDIFVSSKVPFTVHLNASRLIQLDLWIKGGSESAGQYGRCAIVNAYTADQCGNQHDVTCSGAALDVELWVGEKLLTGGIAGHRLGSVRFDQYWPKTDDTTYRYCPYRMPAELATIEAGETLELRIFHRNQGGWIQYGMAGLHHSQVRIPYFDAEEWLFRGRSTSVAQVGMGTGDLEQDSSEAGSNEETTARAPWLALSGVPIAFAGGQRRRRAAQLIVAFAILAGFSGCLGGQGPAESSPGSTSDGRKGTLSVDQIRDEGVLTSEGNGSIIGTVESDLGAPLVGAHVSILGTERFTKSGDRGVFRLLHLAPDTYTIRFEMPEFRAYETELTVSAGFVSRTSVVLYPAIERDVNDRAHRHDYWGPETRLTVFESPLRPHCQSTLPTPNYACRPTVEWALKPSVQNGEIVSNTIRPGTAEVEVVVHWDASEIPVPRLGLRFLANNDLNWTQMYPRASDVPFRIVTSWEMSDAGHQKISTWGFQLFIAPVDYAAASQIVALQTWTLTAAPTLEVKTILHRGVIPLEPAHPDNWKGQDAIPAAEVIFDAGQPTNPTAPIDSTCAATGVTYKLNVVPDGHRIVPSDAVWLNAQLNLSRHLSPTSTWGFAYKRAGAAPGQPLWVYQNTTSEATPEKVIWRLPLGEWDADDIYARRSLMEFTVYPMDPTATCVDITTHYELSPIVLTFTVAAHRDPLPG